MNLKNAPRNKTYTRNMTDFLPLPLELQCYIRSFCEKTAEMRQFDQVIWELNKRNKVLSNVIEFGLMNDFVIAKHLLRGNLSRLYRYT